MQYKSSYTPTAGYSATPFIPERPWNGLDRMKWPNAWYYLVKLYFHPSYHKDTRWGAEAKAEVKGNPYMWEGSM
jgi:hypothetical protein